MFDVCGRLCTLAAGAVYVQGRHGTSGTGAMSAVRRSSGVYVVELTAGNTRQSQQVMLLK
ncbi:MAG: hypothetical protein IPP62_16150 [bacterium]|nr:hypothetical protein [bacterium]